MRPHFAQKPSVVFLRLMIIGGVLLPSPQLQAEQSQLNQSAFLRAKQATVGILADTQDPRMPDVPGKLVVRGTGFHLKDGYIVTARHAAEKYEPATGSVIPQQIRILTDNLHELPAVLVGENAFMDVVVYRVPQEHRSVLPGNAVFNVADAAVGTEVFTVGYPLGWGPTMAFGRLGNTNVFLPTVETRLMQADLSSCSGNSGGGVFDAKGEVIGIVHAVIRTEKEETASSCSRLTFAIPGILAERIVSSAIAGKPLAFSRLGVQLTSVREGTKLRMAVKDVGEPAKSAGLQRHDLLLEIDGVEIIDGAHLKNYLIERTTPGQTVAVKVRRVDVDLTLHVVLGGG
ncbi:MAG: S1C family serine protease [Nitrospira sp.]|nr:S1C family serine protease [Nitrospira sp.]MCP9461569.1 S1C family serine protease [Nitrospira sp.]MCP9474718.1 S1C family serine protease [Nitrospira sp.]